MNWKHVVVFFGTLAALVVFLWPSDDLDDSPRQSASRISKKSSKKSTPSSSKKSKRTAVSRARDVESPGTYSYSKKREDCTKHDRYLDVLKGLGLQLDQHLRDYGSISADEESRIGEKAIEEAPMRFGGTLRRSGQMVDYLMGVARPMLKHVKRKDISYRFYVLEGASIENAFALPGGHILFTEAFLDSWISNEAQLATIVGHEIAHVDLGHPVAVLNWVRALGLPEKDQGTEFLLRMARSPYSSVLEEEADDVGAELLHEVGYSVFQSVAVWENRLGKPGSSQDRAPENILDTIKLELEGLKQTHPNEARRACRLRQKAYDLYAKDPLTRPYVGKKNWRMRKALSERVY